ncbi:hypothetical protein POTOM_030708 [Populus tomentosa]|uniref:F-box domain-containing protein n=1 Tax=Populus tomentosa TaxID=118781 RepID=A0A8X8CRU1_POPTO|nr:hypothetical protein POTOM_030708 [Populus tomentosa]
MMMVAIIVQCQDWVDKGEEEGEKVEDSTGTRKDKIGIVLKSEDGSVNGVDGRLLMSDNVDNNTKVDYTPFGKLPDHLLVEIFVRVPVSEWAQISCVKRQWANVFRGECLWQAALTRTRYTALCVSKRIFALDGEIDEIVGHAYLFLKEQLEFFDMPSTSSILHGTIIDQFIACGKSRDIAHELASQIWLAVLDNLEDNEHTFLILKRLALEGDVFLPYPYTKSIKVQWKVFEKLFTDFRDCFNRVDYYDVLGCAKNKFEPIPSAWLGY